MQIVPFIDTIAEHVERGECLLFLGAGVHYGPPDDSPEEYPEDQRPLLGGALAERLAERCAFSQRFPDENPRDLQRVALCYQQERGREALINEIKAAVQDGKRPSPVLHALAHLPFPIIITTNYDKLYETALYQAEKTPVVGSYDTYRGIEPFRYVDAPIFFGRKEEAHQLLRVISIYRGVLLYGDSGAGKSSVINAGLIPLVLEEGFQPERLRIQPRLGEEIIVERISEEDTATRPICRRTLRRMTTRRASSCPVTPSWKN